MPKIRVSAILRTSFAAAMMVSAALLYPLVVGYWADLQAQRAQDRDFVIASESDQQMIVRSLLIEETGKSPRCSPDGDCPNEPIYFDRLSATLRSLDPDRIGAKYEVVLVRPYDSLVNWGDASLPLQLQELLDEISQSQTYNADPRLPRIVYVTHPEDLPALGEPGSCGPRVSPRLVRISRAAVQESEDIAIALIARTYCDGSGSPRVAALRRNGAEWRVITFAR